MHYSEQLYQAAQHLIPGGVNSPVRAFKGVGGTPIFFSKGEGAILYDVDQQAYIDYVGSWGPLILGHAHPAVLEAVRKTLDSGLSFGAPTALEIELAQKIVDLMPNIEKVRMVNSGTEATMTAIRLARGITGRTKLIKFDGCYHGHSDSLLVKAGSGLLTLGLPSTAGVPEAIAQETLIASFNDLDAVAQLFDTYADEIAAVIVEPVAGNMGMVLPLPDFLPGLRTLCDQHKSLLIFDEVMTGFRVALGGAQAVYDIKPDLTTLGKVIGGGMPVGAIGGRAQWMDHLAPLGPVYQAGTLSGNPLAMAAGLATLQQIEKPGFYEDLSTRTMRLTQGLSEIAQTFSIPFSSVALGSMFGFCFNAKTRICNYQDVAGSDLPMFQRFYHAMLKQGIYFAPSMYEAGFVSSTHTDEHINQTLHRVQTWAAGV